MYLTGVGVMWNYNQQYKHTRLIPFENMQAPVWGVYLIISDYLYNAA